MGSPPIVWVAGLLALGLLLVAAAPAQGSGHRAPAKADETYATGWTDDLLSDDPDRRLRVHVQANVTWYWDNLTLTTSPDRARPHETRLDPGLSEARVQVAYEYPTGNGTAEGHRNLTTLQVWSGETLYADLPGDRSLELRLGGALAASVEHVEAEADLALDHRPLTWNGSTAREAGDLTIHVPAGTPLGSRLQGRLATSLAVDGGAALEDPDGTVHRARNATLGPLAGDAAVRLGYEVANRPPTLTVETPTEGSTVEGNLTVRGTADDPDDDVLAVEVRARSPDEIWAYDDPLVTGDWSATLGTAEAPVQEVSVEVRAIDGTAPPVTVRRNVTIAEEDTDGGPGPGNGTGKGSGAASPGPGAAAAAAGLVAAAALGAAGRGKR